ncbi:MAG: hypothetical protein JO217_15995, partial [Acidobacteriaceae bacterium]|nr:hypothetical protein [Acidobacteriaceae bacterium]
MLSRTSLKRGVQTAGTRVVSDQLDRARTQFHAGEFGPALTTLQHALSQAHASGDGDGEAKALIGIAACQLNLFDYRDALKNSDIARKVAEQTGDRATAGAAWINRSSIFYQLGDFDSVRDAAIHAVSALGSAERPELLARALLLEGRLYWNTKDQDDRADKIYKTAVAVARRVESSPPLEAAVWDEYGTALLLGGRPEAARDKLLRARDIEEASHDNDGLAFTYEHLAELELSRATP